MNSVAILSDAIHDLGDSLALGLAWILEKKSHGKSTDSYSYGFRRLSIVSAFFTAGVLILGSCLVIYQSVVRILHPEPADAVGMMGFAVLGIIVNGAAFFKLNGGNSHNENALKWHLIEDVMGWVIVLIGAIIMKFADLPLLDPILGLGLAIWILFNVIKGLKKTIDVFLQAVPEDLSLTVLTRRLKQVPGVEDLHHLHLWTMDGEAHIFTAHVVMKEALTSDQVIRLKCQMKDILLKEYKIKEATLEFEWPLETCNDLTHD
ncbi:MAG: cation transporter [Oligoflexia bacterium]|nr:MAG: cation transporter [Oligoflexia bacterium]